MTLWDFLDGLNPLSFLAKMAERHGLRGAIVFMIVGTVGVIVMVTVIAGVFAVLTKKNTTKLLQLIQSMPLTEVVAVIVGYYVGAQTLSDTAES